MPPLVHDQSQFMSSTAVASAARRSDAPAPYAAAESEHRQIVAAARRSLKALGPDSTLKQLRLHLEVELQRPLDDWKGVLKQAAEEYAAATLTDDRADAQDPAYAMARLRETPAASPSKNKGAKSSLRSKPGRPHEKTHTLDEHARLKRLVVDPRTSKFVGRWDGVTALALVFTALCTPYEVALVPASLSAHEGWFIINRIVDAIFIGDFILQFFLMYMEPATLENAAHWVHEHDKIATHYIRSPWFYLDLMAILVSAFDYAALAQDTSNLGAFKALRVLRALRLIKLLRLLRASRMLKRWEVRVAIDYAKLELATLIGKILFSCHLFACIWALQASFSDSKLNTWMGAGGYCYPCGGETDDQLCPIADDVSGHHVQPHPTLVYACVSSGTIYAAALYWSIMTITSIGYGDIAATGLNELELTFGAILMLLAGIMWADFIAGFVTFISTVGKESTEFRQTLKALNEFMSRARLPADLCLRVREYFHQTQHLRESEKRSVLLETMSPALQAEVSWTVNQRWLERVWFLADAPQALVVQLSTCVAAQVFAPSETVPLGKLYIVHRGIALYGGRVLTAGKVWGEDSVILRSAPLLSRYMAHAMNYLECYSISAESFTRIAATFPKFAKVIRRRATRLAVRRGFVIAAGAVADGRQISSLVGFSELSFSLIAQLLKENYHLDYMRDRLGESSDAVDPSRSTSPPPPPRPTGGTGIGGAGGIVQLGQLDARSISLIAQEVSREVNKEMARSFSKLEACAWLARVAAQVQGAAMTGALPPSPASCASSHAPTNHVQPEVDEASADPEPMASPLYTHSRIFRREMTRSSVLDSQRFPNNSD